MKTPATLDPSSRWGLFAFPDHPDICPHSASILRGVMVLTVGSALASTRSMVSFPSHVRTIKNIKIKLLNYFLCSVHVDRRDLCSRGNCCNCTLLLLFRTSLHDAGSISTVNRNRFPSKFSQQWFDLNNIRVVQVNNKKICISYKKNILFALITAIIAGMHFS